MTVSRELSRQLKRLERCFSLLDLPVNRRPGATQAEVEKLEQTTGIALDTDLKQMWFYSNGSGAQPWFVCDEEQGRSQFVELIDGHNLDAASVEGSVFNLYPIERVIESWAFYQDVDEHNPEGWATGTPDSFHPQKLDKRIGPQMLRHKRRLPFGTLFMLSDELLLDACPSKKGKYGQIVRYSHDPDSLTYATSTFAEFLDRSLYWMERLIPRNLDVAREVFIDQTKRDYSKF